MAHSTLINIIYAQKSCSVLQLIRYEIELFQYHQLCPKVPNPWNNPFLEPLQHTSTWINNSFTALKAHGGGGGDWEVCSSVDSQVRTTWSDSTFSNTFTAKVCKNYKMYTRYHICGIILNILNLKLPFFQPLL